MSKDFSNLLAQLKQDIVEYDEGKIPQKTFSIMDLKGGITPEPDLSELEQMPPEQIQQSVSEEYAEDVPSMAAAEVATSLSPLTAAVQARTPDPTQELMPAKVTQQGLWEKHVNSWGLGLADLTDEFGSLLLMAQYITPIGGFGGVDPEKPAVTYFKDKADEMRDYYRISMPKEIEEFKWKDLGRLDFWATKVTRQIPNMLSFFATGGVGAVAAKSTAKLGLRFMARTAGKYGKAAIPGATLVTKSGKLLQKGKGFGGALFQRKAKMKAGKVVAGSTELELTSLGEGLVQFTGAGFVSNAIEGGMVAGDAAERAIEMGFDNKVAGHVGAETWKDNAKWMLIDAVQQSLIWGGASKGFLRGLTAAATRRPVKNFGNWTDTLMSMATIGGIEGFTEQYQEVYQEWATRTNLAEANGEDFMPYIDFFNSPEMLETRGVSFASGLLFGGIGGFVNSKAERSRVLANKELLMKRIIEQKEDPEAWQIQQAAIEDYIQEVIEHGNPQLLQLTLEDMYKRNIISQEELTEYQGIIEDYVEIWDNVPNRDKLNQNGLTAIFREKVWLNRYNKKKATLKEEMNKELKAVDENITTEQDGKTVDQLRKEEKDKIKKDYAKQEAAINSEIKKSQAKIQKILLNQNDRARRIGKEQGDFIERVTGLNVNRRKKVENIVEPLTTEEEKKYYGKIEEEEKQARIIPKIISAPLKAVGTVAKVVGKRIGVVKEEVVEKPTEEKEEVFDIKTYAPKNATPGAVKAIQASDLTKEEVDAIKGTGTDGRITKYDVNQVVKKKDKPEVKPKAKPKAKKKTKAKKRVIKKKVGRRERMAKNRDKRKRRSRKTKSTTSTQSERIDLMDMLAPRAIVEKTMQGALNRKGKRQKVYLVRSLEDTFPGSWGAAYGLARYIEWNPQLHSLSWVKKKFFHEGLHIYYPMISDHPLVKEVIDTAYRAGVGKKVREQYPDLVRYIYNGQEDSAMNLWYEILKNKKTLPAAIKKQISEWQKAKNAQEAFDLKYKIIANLKKANIISEVADSQQKDLNEEIFTTFMENEGGKVFDITWEGELKRINQGLVGRVWNTIKSLIGTSEGAAMDFLKQNDEGLEYLTSRQIEKKIIEENKKGVSPRYKARYSRKDKGFRDKRAEKIIQNYIDDHFFSGEPFKHKHSILSGARNALSKGQKQTVISQLQKDFNLFIEDLFKKGEITKSQVGYLKSRGVHLLKNTAMNIFPGGDINTNTLAGKFRVIKQAVNNESYDYRVDLANLLKNKNILSELFNIKNADDYVQDVLTDEVQESFWEQNNNPISARLRGMFKIFTNDYQELYNKNLPKGDIDAAFYYFVKQTKNFDDFVYKLDEINKSGATLASIRRNLGVDIRKKDIALLQNFKGWIDNKAKQAGDDQLTVEDLVLRGVWNNYYNAQIEDFFVLELLEDAKGETKRQTHTLVSQQEKRILKSILTEFDRKYTTRFMAKYTSKKALDRRNKIVDNNKKQTGEFVKQLLADIQDAINNNQNINSKVFDLLSGIFSPKSSYALDQTKLINERFYFNGKKARLQDHFLSIKSSLIKRGKFNPYNKRGEVEKLLSELYETMISESRTKNFVSMVLDLNGNQKTILGKNSQLHQRLNKLFVLLNKSSEDVRNNVIEELRNSLGANNQYLEILEDGEYIHLNPLEGMFSAFHDRGIQYNNLTPRSMFLADLGLFFMEDESYKMPIMVFSKSKRRYYVDTDKLTIEDIQDRLEEMNELFSDSRYTEGERILPGNIVQEKGVWLVKDDKGKNVVNEEIKRLKRRISNNVALIKKDKAFEKAGIKVVKGKVQFGKNIDTLLESYVYNEMINRFDATRMLVGVQENFKNDSDYQIRAYGSQTKMTIANPDFRIGAIVHDDIFKVVNNKTKKVKWLTQSEIDEQKINKKTHTISISTDSGSWILSEDAARIRAEMGISADIGNNLKFVYNGTDSRYEMSSDRRPATSIEKGGEGRHFYFKTAWQTLTKSRAKGNPYLEKLYEVMSAAKKAANHQNSIILGMSSSSIKVGNQDNFLTSDIFNLSTEQAVEEFKQSHFTGEEFIGIDGQYFGLQNEMDFSLKGEKGGPKRTVSIPVQLILSNLGTNPDVNTRNIENIIADILNENVSNISAKLARGKMPTAKELQSWIREYKKDYKSVLVSEEIDTWLDEITYGLHQITNSIPYLLNYQQKIGDKTLSRSAAKFDTNGTIGVSQADIGEGLGAYYSHKVSPKEAAKIGNKDLSGKTILVSDMKVPFYLQEQGIKEGDLFIASRVPHDGKHNTVVGRVVGFLDKDSGSGVVIPAEVKKNWGADEDGDFVFMNFPISSISTRGMVRKQTALQNDKINNVLGSIMSIIGDKKRTFETQKEMNFMNETEPVIKKLRQKGIIQESKVSYLLPTGQSDAFENSPSYANLIGQMVSAHSGANNFAKNDSKIRLKKIIGSFNGKNIDFSKITDTNNKDGWFQTANAVNIIIDNDKKLQAKDLGFTANFIPLIGSLLRVKGMGYEQLAYILNSKAAKAMDRALGAYELEDSSKAMENVLFKTLLELYNGDVKKARRVSINMYTQFNEGTLALEEDGLVIENLYSENASLNLTAQENAIKLLFIQHKVGMDLVKYNKFLSIHKDGYMPTTLEGKRKLLRELEEIYNEQGDVRDQIFEKKTMNKMFNEPMYKKAKEAISIAISRQEKLGIQNAPLYNKIIDKVKQLTGGDRFIRDSHNKNKSLVNDIANYLMQQEMILAPILSNNRSIADFTGFSFQDQASIVLGDVAFDFKKNQVFHEAYTLVYDELTKYEALPVGKRKNTFLDVLEMSDNTNLYINEYILNSDNKNQILKIREDFAKLNNNVKDAIVTIQYLQTQFQVPGTERLFDEATIKKIGEAQEATIFKFMQDQVVVSEDKLNHIVEKALMDNKGSTVIFPLDPNLGMEINNGLYRINTSQENFYALDRELNDRLTNGFDNLTESNHYITVKEFDKQGRVQYNLARLVRAETIKGDNFAYYEPLTYKLPGKPLKTEFKVEEPKRTDQNIDFNMYDEGFRSRKSKADLENEMKMKFRDMTISKKLNKKPFLELLKLNDTAANSALYKKYENEYKKVYNKYKELVARKGLDNYSVSQQSVYDLMNEANKLTNNEFAELTSKPLIESISVKIAEIAGQVQSKEINKNWSVDKDFSDLYAWLVANNVSSTRPEIQALVKIMETQYRRYMRGFIKEQEEIRNAIAAMEKEKFSDLNWWQKVVKKVKAFFKPKDYNERMYGNMISISEKVVKGAPVREMKLKTESAFLATNPSSAEKKFYYLFKNKVQKYYKATGQDVDARFIPNHSIKNLEVLANYGLFGLYHRLTGALSNVGHVKIKDTVLINGKPETRTLTLSQWRNIIFVDPRYSFMEKRTRMNNLISRAKVLAKDNINDDGSPIKMAGKGDYSLLNQEMLYNFSLGSPTANNFIGTTDLGLVLEDFVKASSFYHGNPEKGIEFRGFKNMTSLVDGAILFNQINNNPNASKYVKRVWRDYFMYGKRMKSETKYGMYGDKMLDFFRQLTLFGVLGFNVSVGFVNSAIGKYQTFRKLGFTDFKKGEHRYWNPKTFKKAQNIVRKEYLYEERIWDVVGFRAKNEFFRWSLLPMELTEKWIQGAMFLGMLTEKQWNAYDDNGNVITAKRKDALTDLQVVKMKDKITATHGKGYTRTDQRMIQLTSWGSFIMQFKRYLPTYFIDRFGKQDINRFGEETMGSYVPYTQRTLDFARDWMSGKKSLKEFKEQFNNFTDAEKAQSGIILRGMGLAVLVMLLAAASDKDDPWREHLTRLQDDINVFVNPSRFAFTLKPAGINTMQHTWGMAHAAMNGEKIQRASIYGEKGESEAIREAKRILPKTRVPTWIKESGSLIYD